MKRKESASVLGESFSFLFLSFIDPGDNTATFTIAQKLADLELDEKLTKVTPDKAKKDDFPLNLGRPRGLGLLCHAQFPPF